MEESAGLLEALTLIAKPYIGIFAFDYGRYLVAAGLVALMLILLSAAATDRRRVRSRDPEAGQRRREFLYSTSAASIFALVGLGVYHGAANGIFRIYAQIAEYGWIYWALSVIAMIVVHDAYFYWTHRLLHMPSLFKWTHAAHHRSVAPTPWAAYAFAPGEALVQALFVPLFLLVVPMHDLAVFVWMAHQILRNAVGHAGVELLPRSWIAAWWGRWITTTLHHDLHHAHGKGNYGLYFAWWDKWCGTERPEYRQRLDALAAKMESDISSRVATAER